VWRVSAGVSLVDDIEHACVSAALHRPDLVPEAGLLPGDFASVYCANLWQGLLDLRAKNSKIDPAILADHTATNLSAIADVAAAVPTGENLAWYARRVKSQACERQARRIVDHWTDEPVTAGEEWVVGLRQDLASVELPEARRGVTCAEGIKDAFAAIERRVENPGARDGSVATHVGRLDSILFGLHRGSMSILAARPSVGKSALLACIAREAAGRGGARVDYRSIEDSRRALFNRWLAQAGRISLERIGAGDLTCDELAKLAETANAIQGLDIVVDDSAPQDYRLMLNDIERSVIRRNVDLVIIDYVQLLWDPRHRGKRNDELTKISTELAALARRLDVALLVASQLNRAAEKERPCLAHLRDCGSLEQAADVVIILDDFRWRGGRPDDMPITLARIAKNKHGRVGGIPLRWTKQYTLFDEPDEDERVRFNKWVQSEPTRRRWEQTSWN
jgi:replicative DNA helicase